MLIWYRTNYLVCGGRQKQSDSDLGISETPKRVTVLVSCAVYVTEVLLSASLHVVIAADTASPSSFFIAILLDCLCSGQ